MEDRDLFDAWRAGDRAAGTELIERHYDAIGRFFATKAGEHADDLVQRTFLRFAESTSPYRGEGSFRAYLFGVARNVLLEFIRGRVRDGAAVDLQTSAIVDFAPGAATLAAQRAEHRLLVHGLQHIPVDLQMLLELCYWEELSVEELAEVLEVPAGTIKSRLHRARRLLREAMEALPATPEQRQSVRALLKDWVDDMQARTPPGEEPEEG